ncbi:trypsin inhibitor like cysteine rich domain-containing protein [Ditylenchus destructor]|uniref:Trypsin inhibitor like cysteine rich domain-containing protein n=1 Tax=Ditylenchus destructor TaxID=166010 RepID=A0AAD4NBU5_9BILA|nr:trypsin inhibitor like cysteine rich domain-containing protein [Ditylenchus destructor]
MVNLEFIDSLSREMWTIVPVVYLILVCSQSSAQNATESPCGSNEEFRECGTACEPTCDNPSPRICTLQCIVNVCQCTPGYFRNDDEECVRLSHCNNSTNITVLPCGTNEHFVSCSTCERTCANPNPICTKECKPPKCQCLPGYVRNSFGRCVNQSQCDVNDPCEGKRCPTGQHCELRNVTCVRAPCPPIPTCVNNTVSGRTTVDTVSLDVTEEDGISPFD